MRSSLLRLWLLRQTLSLPAALLRAFAGGGVINIKGRTLDPQIQFLWRTWFAPAESSGRMPLTVTDKSLSLAREEWRDLAARGDVAADIGVCVETVGDSAIGGLLLTPPHVDVTSPLLVFFPQGGGVLGGPELSRTFCALFAAEAGCPVFIPNLRLAPEQRFPAALDDARAALDWAMANAVRLGAVSGRVAIGGALTGAGLAARLCLELTREGGRPLPCAQLLVTPLLDLSDATLSASPFASMWPLSAADIHLVIAYYAGAGVDLADLRLSPGLDRPTDGQPPALVVCAGLDPLAAQGEAFVHRLVNAGQTCIYRRYDSLPLGFDLLAGLVDAARAATRDMARTWKTVLDTVSEARDRDAA